MKKNSLEKFGIRCSKMLVPVFCGHAHEIGNAKVCIFHSVLNLSPAIIPPFRSCSGRFLERSMIEQEQFRISECIDICSCWLARSETHRVSNPPALICKPLDVFFSQIVKRIETQATL